MTLGNEEYNGFHLRIAEELSKSGELYRSRTALHRARARIEHEVCEAKDFPAGAVLSTHTGAHAGEDVEREWLHQLVVAPFSSGLSTSKLTGCAQSISR